MYQLRTQNFPGGWGFGGANSLSGCAYLLFCNFFCRKLHENERIWIQGGHIPGVPLDPPMCTIVSQVNEDYTYVFRNLIVFVERNYMYKFYHVSFQASLYRFLSIILMVLTVSILTELYYGMYL